MVQTLCQDDVALYVSPCCADIERNRSKKGGFFLQETMPCIHGPSLCVCMPALVVAVLIAYDYECARNFQQACFWGLKNKHFWLRGCGPSLYIYWDYENTFISQCNSFAKGSDLGPILYMYIPCHFLTGVRLTVCILKKWSCGWKETHVGLS